MWSVPPSRRWAEVDSRIFVRRSMVKKKECHYLPFITLVYTGCSLRKSTGLRAGGEFEDEIPNQLIVRLLVRMYSCVSVESWND